MDRKSFIGSSDISCILGLNPFKTVLQLWAEKTGEVEEKDLSDKSFVEWGTRLESVVADKFAEKHNVKLIAYKKRFTHKVYPYMSCELDRIIAGTDGIVEVKTTNAWNYKAWEGEDDEIPAYIICQVQFSMGLSGRKTGHIAVLVGGNKYLEKKIEFDQEFYNDMVEKARVFWEDHVLAKVPPIAVADDNKFMVNLYPQEKNDKIIAANEEVENMIKLRQELSGQIGDMIKQKNEVEARLKEIIGENQGLTTEHYKCTWKEQHKKSYVVPESSTRVLRVSLLKKESE